MKNNKIKNETRVEKSTVASKWRPTNLLEAPEPRPGFKQRWIATMVLGQETPTNVAKRMREGWQPRDIKTVSDANLHLLHVYLLASDRVFVSSLFRFA
jgi:hypothetical protein